MFKKYQNKLFCFSPAAMIVTFIIEVVLVVYTIARYKMNTLARLVAAEITLLAVFQLAEYQVCQGSPAHIGGFSRLGFIAITMLPPLGIHTIQVLSKKVPNILVWLAYLTGFGFVLTFGLHASAFNSYICAGNYDIFHLAPRLGGMFLAYYYFWLILGIFLSLHLSISASIKIRQALIYQAFGYLSFLLPTGLVNAADPSTIQALPSIMCGFAVIYALVLSFGIAPLALKRKNHQN